MSAAAPATCGVAIDVPSQDVAIAAARGRRQMPTPGAKTSTVVGAEVGEARRRVVRVGRADAEHVRRGRRRRDTRRAAAVDVVAARCRRRRRRASPDGRRSRRARPCDEAVAGEARVDDPDAVVAGEVERLGESATSPAPSAPSTRSGTSLASGATPATPMPLPRPRRSCPPRACRGRSRRSGRRRRRRSRSRRRPAPARSGCVRVDARVDDGDGLPGAGARRPRPR